MEFYDKLCLTVIYGAICGESSSINKVFSHYDRYINALCINTTVDSGVEYKYIDEYMKSELKRKLLQAILKFKI